MGSLIGTSYCNPVVQVVSLSVVTIGSLTCVRNVLVVCLAVASSARVRRQHAKCRIWLLAVCLAVDSSERVRRQHANY